jgi:hypothetical protein
LSPCAEQKLQVRSTHINDIPLLDETREIMNDEAKPDFFALLSDWLALALSPKLSLLFHSTFSESAMLEFYT